MFPGKIESQIGIPSMYARPSKFVHEKNEILAGYAINRFIGKKSVEPMGHTTPIDFKFDFLAPAITKPTLQGSTDKVSSSCMSHEMDVLQSFCHSKEHQALVTHPVLKAYTWIKWRLISKVYNRSLRLQVLLAMCVTWAIFDQFGGRKWKHIGVYGNKNYTHSFYHHHCFVELEFNWTSWK